MSLPVFVLNLPRDGARRERMTAELARVGLDGHFIDGVDAGTLSQADWDRYDRSRCRAIYGVDMLATELACYLAHERIFRKIVDENIDAALILEDDCQIANDLPSVLDALMATPPAARLWQVVRLSTMREGKISAQARRLRPLRRLGDDRGLYRVHTHVLGLQGYVMTAAGARRMLDYGRKIFMPIDHTLDRYWENRITPFIVHPCPVVHHDEGHSTIGERDPRRRTALGLGGRWVRRVNRWRDGVGKRLYNALHP
ncbi:glycosyltransferase family 25 protein [Rhodospirillum rubrum]|uniref:Glycosyl transferase, family 25 n=1 Tax=Rhodospirillum rubrum (strain ATCC 11170 / ATH 1.1.1 / DSM 467 / LMG 4362 / NCIMB 8255 / S1) TaxID=269796 RepID=Q2RS64_RHORT|nr:glycosyltransferase family 25 protein [Rhodospirillum rubrum]ABC23031.1 Glycosyl transferase, family 25 [Rhodospirillum rubrum ATCC 11170]AEO48760.1 glycosyl transferase family protein [Rhodospirillum rubrum F11]MBK5954658.1 glycosyl transferase [Rhodospirillum rubrum]QXG79015.1 glycosyltransferase family 25 protein [Rhodospirillum rubrum]